MKWESLCLTHIHNTHSILFLHIRTLNSHSAKIKYRKHNMLLLMPPHISSVIILLRRRQDDDDDDDGKYDCCFSWPCNTRRYTIILAKTHSHTHTRTPNVFVCTLWLLWHFISILLGIFILIFHLCVCVCMSCTFANAAYSIVLWLNCVKSHCGLVSERWAPFLLVLLLLFLLVLFVVVIMPYCQVLPP